MGGDGDGDGDGDALDWTGLGGEKDGNGNGNKRKITLKEDDFDQTNYNRAYFARLDRAGIVWFVKRRMLYCLVVVTMSVGCCTRRLFLQSILSR